MMQEVFLVVGRSNGLILSPQLPCGYAIQRHRWLGDVLNRSALVSAVQILVQPRTKVNPAARGPRGLGKR